MKKGKDDILQIRVSVNIETPQQTALSSFLGSLPARQRAKWLLQALLEKLDRELFYQNTGANAVPGLAKQVIESKDNIHESKKEKLNATQIPQTENVASKKAPTESKAEVGREDTGTPGNKGVQVDDSLKSILSLGPSIDLD